MSIKDLHMEKYCSANLIGRWRQPIAWLENGAARSLRSELGTRHNGCNNLKPFAGQKIARLPKYIFVRPCPGKSVPTCLTLVSQSLQVLP